jgi:hypothetical protein
MTRYRAAVITVGMVVAFWGAKPAAAQQVSSFEQLQLLVKPGDTVYVTDAAGVTTKGKIQSLSADSLRLATNKAVKDFSQKDAARIRQWRSDSLANGAAIGAASGAGFGAVMAILCAASGDCGAELEWMLIGSFAAIGTGVGAGTDALIVSRHTIYKAPGVVGSRRIDVKPIVTGDRKGAAVAFSF